MLIKNEQFFFFFIPFLNCQERLRLFYTLLVERLEANANPIVVYNKILHCTALHGLSLSFTAVIFFPFSDQAISVCGGQSFK